MKWTVPSQWRCHFVTNQCSCLSGIIDWMTEPCRELKILVVLYSWKSSRHPIFTEGQWKGPGNLQRFRDLIFTDGRSRNLHPQYLLALPCAAIQTRQNWARNCTQIRTSRRNSTRGAYDQGYQYAPWWTSWQSYQAASSMKLKQHVNNYSMPLVSRKCAVSENEHIKVFISWIWFSWLPVNHENWIPRNFPAIRQSFSMDT